MNTQRNLERDLANSTHIRERVQDSAYAHKLYAALCNTDWQPQDIMEILQEHTWSASWRSVGAIIAELRGAGDYLDWYCSGLEGYVHPEIAQDLAELGWVCVHLDRYLGEEIPEAKWGKFTGVAGSLQQIGANPNDN